MAPRFVWDVLARALILTVASARESLSGLLLSTDVSSVVTPWNAEIVVDPWSNRHSSIVSTHVGNALAASSDAPLQSGMLGISTVCIVIGCAIVGTALFGGCGNAASDMSSNTGLGLGIQTYAQLAIVLAFVLLSITHPFTQNLAGRTGYSVVYATVLIYLLKMIAANIMYMTKAPASCSVKDLMNAGHPNFPRTPAFVLLLVPSVLFAIYDVLSFLSLNMLDPVTYCVLSRSRILLIAGLWQPAMGRLLSSLQLTALFFFFVASVCKGLDHLDGKAGASERLAVWCVLCQVLVSAIANVASEVCLKQMPLHTDLLNTCAYFESLVALLVGLTVSGGPGLIVEMLSIESWKKLGGDPFMVMSILLLAAVGITTAYLLRDLSNILKELIIGVVLICTAFVEYSVLREHALSALSASAVLLTMVALWVYNLNPVVTIKSSGLSLVDADARVASAPSRSV